MSTGLALVESIPRWPSSFVVDGVCAGALAADADGIDIVFIVVDATAVSLLAHLGARLLDALRWNYFCVVPVLVLSVRPLGLVLED